MATVLPNIDGPRLASWLGLAVSLAAVAWLAVSAAIMVWTFAVGPDSLVRVRTDAPGQRAAAVNADYSILARVTPFRSGLPAGASPSSPEGPGSRAVEAIAEEELADVEETTLDLVLHGLIKEGENGGHAFISVGGGPQTAYGVGEELDGTKGVTLERIRVNSVLLRREGELESLTYGQRDSAITTLSAVSSLDGSDRDGPTSGDAGEDERAARLPARSTRAITPTAEGDGADAAAMDAGTRAGDGSGRGPETSGGTAAGASAATAARRSSVPGDDDEEADNTAAAKAAPARPELPVIARSLTRTEVETLALSLRLEENGDAGEGGLYVFPTGNIDVFVKSGLEAGDLITEVAGMKLDSRSDFDRLLQTVEQQRQITLAVRRGQDTRSLRVTVID